MSFELGSPQAAEQLLDDLYVSLRRKLALWAPVTHQTPQARMGYVGQHLTSVVTGFPGGRSGARGHDLVLPDGRYSEIKTCSRVDQLGLCSACGGPVSSLEVACGACDSDLIVRRDDSKWLIAVPNEQELPKIFGADAYYLVLFDFEDFANPLGVNARIYEVDPLAPGFALCMVDYFWNIRAKSESGAPFNLWPFSPKFHLMKPTLIYHARISETNEITTLLFPGDGPAVPIEMPPLPQFSRSKMTADAIRLTSERLGFTTTQPNKGKLFEEVQAAREASGWPNDLMMDVLAEAIYLPGILDHTSSIPADTFNSLNSL